MPQAIQLWALVVGEIVAFAVVFAIFYWQRRQRKLRKERPPVETMLLRPPGYTLSIQLGEKERRFISQLLILAGSAAGLAFVLSIMLPPFLSRETQLAVAKDGGWLAVLANPKIWPLLLLFGCLTFGLCCGVIYGLVSTLKLEQEMRRDRLGLSGEQAVGEKLLELALHGYQSFHDFPASKDWNIDHVAVGPAGVFAIETKTRSKRKAPPGRKEQEVFYDGKRLAFPWFNDNKPTVQANANAKWLAGYLRKATGLEKVCVDPMLVIPGWFVVYENNPKEHNVQAMPESLLSKHLRGQPRKLSDEEIQRIAFQLEQKCRDVEF